MVLGIVGYGYMIVVGGGELVARELAAREHHPAAETTAAPSPSRSDRGRTWSTKQLLRVIKISLAYT